MNVTEAVARRRSIRAFLDKSVDEALLRGVLEKAQMSPSSLNFQPWRAVVLSGEPLRGLSAELMQAEPQDPPEYPPGLVGAPQHYLERRDAIMAERLKALGIARDDAEGRAAYVRRNYAFFGAPACLFAFVPRALGPTGWASTALWYQTVTLLLVEQGLGTCPQESLAHFGKVIKRACGIDDGEYLFWAGLAIGWPDMDAPVNNYPRPRADLDEVARFVGF